MLIGFLALVAAALFAGAAIYVSVAEHPARLKLDDLAMLRQWKASYAAAAPMQAGLATVSGLLGLWVGVPQRDPVSIIAAALMLLLIPYTLVVVMPVNRRLEAAAEGRPDLESRSLMRRWGKLHAVRTVLAGLAAALMVCALLPG